MSDCFDHMCDAYERHWGGDSDEPRYYSRNYSNFVKDPLYYHKKYYFSGFKSVGDAYQILYTDGTCFYVPKALVKNLTSSSCYILKTFKPRRLHQKREQEERPKPTIPWDEAQYYL